MLGLDVVKRYEDFPGIRMLLVYREKFLVVFLQFSLGAYIIKYWIETKFKP